MGQPIDAIFNNAGFGLIAPIESASDEAIRQQFEANYFGTMAITRRAMEHFRQRGRGRLMVNTSIGGRMAFPTLVITTQPNMRWRLPMRRSGTNVAVQISKSKSSARIHPNQLRDSWDANVRREEPLPCQWPLMACSVNARRHNGNATNRDRPSDCQRLIRHQACAEISRRKAQWQPVVIAKTITRQLVSGTH